MSRSFKGAAFSWWGKILLIVDILGFGVSSQYGRFLFAWNMKSQWILALPILIPVYMLVVRLKRPSLKWGATLFVDPMDGDAIAIGLFLTLIVNFLIGYGLSSR